MLSVFVMNHDFMLMAAKVSVFVDENHDFIKYHCHMAAKVSVFVDENHDYKVPLSYGC